MARTIPYFDGKSVTQAPPAPIFTADESDIQPIAYNIYETETTLIVAVELPGLDLSDAPHITAQPQVLHLSGNRAYHPSETVTRYHRMQTPVGTFRCSIDLPVIVASQTASARYLANGFLEITFQKPEHTIAATVVPVRQEIAE